MRKSTVKELWENYNNIANDEKLISNNLKHFSKIENLNLESWLEDN